MFIEYFLNYRSTFGIDFQSIILTFVFLVITGFLSITVREYVRSSLIVKFGGDAKKSLNPIKHLSLKNAASVALIALFSLSWVKSTVISEFSRGKNIRISLSGLLSHATLALICVVFYDIVYVLSVNLYLSTEAASPVLIWLSTFFSTGVLVNVGYVILGILPIPGLDGGNILSQILPEKISEKLQSFTNYSYIVILFVILVAARSGFSQTAVSAASSGLETPILSLLNLIVPIE